MEREEVYQVLEKIESAYQQFKISDETVIMWTKACRGMDFNLVMQKLIAFIAKSPFPPTIAEIAAFGVKRNDFLDKVKQWEQEGRDRIERDRRNSSRKLLPGWLSC
ncbi:replicative helicase loader/inhibitor [Neobacillus novalis]|uniref:Replicative helicase loader/inhibitor n=1 Tax=Neobacillus novalis TaxID=220687 RepID=A0AA95SCQ3_9BACI|nr:replicative helicase loader/inhibitor [Neobacillus novalis]WHY88167.1 replicative helicase loader/inhibitor [Neobacillus novalis]